MGRSRELDLELADRAQPTWDPVAGGAPCIVCFRDDKTFDLGIDEDGSRFGTISGLLMAGNYYPPDAVRFDGRFRDEHRNLRVGDRVVQRAPLFGKLGGPLVRSVAEIYVADRQPDLCTFGYVTTTQHLARGIWTAQLTLKEARLTLRVSSTASPGSLLYWLGVPCARWLQLRARRRGFENIAGASRDAT